MSEESQNPFHSPAQVPPQPEGSQPPAPQPGDDQFAPCPNCGVQSARLCGFTWWGGALGPRLLTHVACRNCGTQFNGKSGAANTTGIVIYTLVSLAIAIPLGIAFIFWTMN